MKYKFSIAACARWESKNILEWVAYHRSIGFDHIYLYCNDDDPTELYECLMPILTEKDPYITFVHYPFQGFQEMMYKHYLKNYSHEAEWLMFLDIDEFLALKGKDSIHSFMKGYEEICDALYFNWIFFGNSGFVDRPEGSVLLQYIKRDAILNHHTKVITRRSSLQIAAIIAEQNRPFWHGWGHALGSNFRQINVIGDSMSGYYDDFPNKAREYLDYGDRQARIIEIGAVYHYAFRSEKDIARRLERGIAGDFHGQLAFKKVEDEGYLKAFLENFSQVEDVYLRDYWRRQLEGGWRASIVPRPPGPNIALGKPATQSSVSQWSRKDTPEKDASRLVSGQFSGWYNNHTGFDNPPWWRVDLGELAEIGEIRIYNRLDADPGIMARTARIAIQVSDDARVWTAVFRRAEAAPFGGVDGAPLIWTPGAPVVARFVQIAGLEPGHLHLDQVEIYGAFAQQKSEAPGSQTGPLADYLSGPPPFSLQIGGSSDVKEGWLNTDLFPPTETVLQLDATKTFPVPDRCFDYVYSQHMIEHISFEDGCFMLRECYRVLKPGGVVRIATPAIEFLINLFSPDRSRIEDAYIAWAIQAFAPDALAILPAFVMNNFVRAWGHTFIYDRPTLRLALERAGFMDVTERDLNESPCPALRDLENEKRMPPGFLRLETLIFEGTRP